MIRQYNHATGKNYLSGNQARLLGEKEKNSYKSNAWITYLQAKYSGYALVKARGKGVGLRTFVNDGVDEQGEDIVKPIHFVVFNTDLIEKIN